MNRRHAARGVALLALTISAGSAAFAAAGGLGGPEASAPAPLDEADVLELDLAFFQARVARDSSASASMSESHSSDEIVGPSSSTHCLLRVMCRS